MIQAIIDLKTASSKDEKRKKPRSSWLLRQGQFRALREEGLTEWQANSFYAAGKVVVPALMNTFSSHSFLNKVRRGFFKEIFGLGINRFVNGRIVWLRTWLDVDPVGYSKEICWKNVFRALSISFFNEVYGSARIISKES